MITAAHDTAQRDVRSEIRRINDVVPFPPAVTEILQAVSSGDATLARIAALIGSDPAMTAKILHVANSPFYGLRRDVTDIPQALRMLGMDEIGHLVLTYQMRSRLQSLDDRQRGTLERLWRHSVSVAVTARLLAERFRLPTEGKEYTAGLLHDMGKLVIIQHFPEQYRSVETLVESGGITDLEAEKQVLAIDHTEIGKQLGERWRLPKEYLDAMQYHHRPVASPNFALLCAVVRSADLLTEGWDSGIGERSIGLDPAEDWSTVLSEHVPSITVDSPSATADDLFASFEEHSDLFASMM
ncbi:MAG: HDOD domain-containing protein [Bacteroidetes bacterium]|nr:HDOD domain-containing protein [Bacteroidota bacterium]